MTTAAQNESDVLELQELPQMAPPSQSPSIFNQTSQSANPAILLQLAITQNADIDRLERLMRMQIEWESNEARKAYRRDFAAFKGENIIIPKSKHVDRGRAGSFMQAEYDEVCFRLAPALSKHGFGFRHDQKFGTRPWVTDGVENTTPWVWVTCFLEHKDGHAETLELEGPPGDQTANTAVQNMQLTASILKRQSLLAITGTATKEECDESKLKNGKDKPEPEDASQLNALRDEGSAAAKSGMQALTKWWAELTPQQQKSLSTDFGSMRRVARDVDQRSQE